MNIKFKVSEELKKKYNDYYSVNNISNKRAIAAQQSVKHLMSISPERKVNTLLDIGCGDGALIETLEKIGFSQIFSAIEISDSGISETKKKQIASLRSIDKFDGYNIPAHDDKYDYGTAVHVIEHVEHERAFLKEITRVCKTVYLEVPLELTMNVKKAIEVGAKFGHINFYNLATLRNLIESSGCEIVGCRVFACSLDYEQNESGVFSGTLKYLLRRGFLLIFPILAPKFMSYLAGFIIKKVEDE